MASRQAMRRFTLIVMATIVIGLAGCGEGQLPDRMMGEFATVSGGEANTASGEYSAVGGGSHNSATAFHTTVGGGSYNMANVGHSVVGGGYHNTTSASLTTVSGGYGNVASRRGATVSGGAGNTADARIATIGGGIRNEASGWGDTISGGRHNLTSNLYPTIGGGAENVATGLVATVAGGAGNEATASHATVGGGMGNRATDMHATVSGGYDNIGDGAFSTVIGGSHNAAAGDHSVASGHRARVAAIHSGAFLYADSSDADFHSSSADEFAVRATGGVRFVTAIDSSGNPIAEVKLEPGSGSWSFVSDREVKVNSLPAAEARILALLADLPVTTWNYEGQDPSIRHIGPTAQDFHAAFGYGEDDQHISSVDADGVALAAIQGLYELAQTQAARAETLEAENAALQAQFDDIEARLAALEGGDSWGGGAMRRWYLVTVAAALLLFLTFAGIALVQRGHLLS